ncbi:type II toxin-antitoxin system RelE/ParE family toxin [Gemmatimonadota bacterium]
MRFIETSSFTRAVTDLLTDEEYRSLQTALLLRPEQGALIKSGGGLRKLRWKQRGRGKRGGVRVIYYWYVEGGLLYMVYAYAKADQGDLTPPQIRKLAQLVREEFK